MLIAHRTDGLMILGIDAENVRRLQLGQPIRVRLEPLGGEGQVVICYGPTLDHITDQLKSVFGKLPAEVLPIPWPTDEMHKAGLKEMRNDDRSQSVNLLHAYRAMITLEPAFVQSPLAATRDDALEEAARIATNRLAHNLAAEIRTLKENAAPQRDVASVPRAAVPRETLVQAHQLALSLSGILDYAKSCDAAPTERTPK